MPEPAQTTLYLRGIPARLVREVKALSARRGITLKALLTELMWREVGETPGSAQEPLAEDRRWFEQNRRSLAQQHAGQYLAIVDQSVVDHDKEFDKLAHRVFERFGVRPILMPYCEASAGTVKLRSPRLR